jgi:anti-sigma regulatory factor (Ser/Thr protein kinase)
MDIETEEQKTSRDTQIELRVCADPQYLPVVRALVRGAAELAGVENRDDLITVAVEEALDNVIEHGYGGACNKPIIIRLNKIDGGNDQRAGLEILIRDFGRQVNPESIKGRDLEEAGVGGYGTHIIRSAMDEVEFSHADDCGMQLRMVKYQLPLEGREGKSAWKSGPSKKIGI